MFRNKYRYNQQAPDDGGEPAAEPAAPTPISDDTPADLPSDPPPAEWREDWRDAMSGGDETATERLARYSDPSAVAKALLAAQNKIRAGEVGTPFPEDGTDEQKAAWRAEKGIPDAPDKYNLDFDSGLVIGEDDKSFVDGYLQYAHESNQTPDQVKQNLQWYYDRKVAAEEERREADQQINIETTDKLRAEWGNEYRPHINAIQGFLDTVPEGTKENFMSARMADGTPLMSDPGMLQWLLDQSLEINPHTTLVPAGTADISGSISDEIADIEKMMGDRSSDYHKGPKAEGLQQRYRDLVTARDKIAK